MTARNTQENEPQELLSSLMSLTLSELKVELHRQWLQLGEGRADSQFEDGLVRYIAKLLQQIGQLASVGQPEEFREVDIAEQLADEMGGEAEHRLPDGSRVDIMDHADKIAWEVERVHKWTEGIGQALFYSISTGYEPGLMLLMYGDRERAAKDYLQCLSVVISLRAHGPFHLSTQWVRDEQQADQS